MKFKYKQFGLDTLRPVIPIDVGFMRMSNTSYGVLGQKGFFDKFKVSFDLTKREIELKPRKSILSHGVGHL